MNDREVIDAFVAYLRENGYPGLRIDRRPDEENSASSDIDAIVGPFAVEHTSVDVLPQQRRNEAWFTEALGGLAQELRAPAACRVRVILDYGALRQGQDWPAIRQALKSWLEQEGLSLPKGLHVFESVPGVPFRLHLRKSNATRPGVFFSLFQPEDSSLAPRLQQQLARKAAKLARYQSSMATTVLLLESADIQLMNEITLLSAIGDAFPAGRLPGVDQVWYADTSIPTFLEFMDFTHELRARALSNRGHR